MALFWCIAAALAAEPVAQPPDPADPPSLASSTDPRLEALDAITGLRGLDWGSAPEAGMERVGRNGPGRVHYRRPSESALVGKYRADAISYEYAHDRLATVVLLFRHEYDATGVTADLERSWGPPTFRDELTRVWRGEKVRLVVRQQATDLWIVSYAWLALNAEEP